MLRSYQESHDLPSVPTSGQASPRAQETKSRQNVKKQHLPRDRQEPTPASHTLLQPERRVPGKNRTDTRLPLTSVTSTMVPGVKVHWIGESSGSPDRTVAPLRPVTLYCCAQVRFWFPSPGRWGGSDSTEGRAATTTTTATSGERRQEAVGEEKQKSSHRSVMARQGPLENANVTHRQQQKLNARLREKKIKTLAGIS